MSRPGRPRLVYGVTVPSSAATLLRGQLAWMGQQGWDVHLVTTPGEQLGLVEEREGVTTHPLAMEREMSPWADLVALVRWVRLLRRLRPAALDVGTPKAGLLGGLAGWLTRVPVRVYVMRGLRVEGAASRSSRALLWAAERLATATATDVVCVSESLLAEARRLRLVGRRALVLGQGSSNGVDAARWDAALGAVDRRAERDRLGVADGELLVGFVGRLTPDKGIHELLRAIGDPSCSGARLLLVGPVEDASLAAVLEQLGDRVVRRGWTDHVEQVYAAVDVLCLPTHREGFPNVVLEAAVAGVPTITTTATGARDSVVDGVTGWLVPPRSPADLAHAVQRCVGDREGTRRAGQAARVRALSDFSPEAVWRPLERLLAAG